MDETLSPELATLILRRNLLGTTPPLPERLPPRHILRQLAVVPWGPENAAQLLTRDPAASAEELVQLALVCPDRPPRLFELLDDPRIVAELERRVEEARGLPAWAAELASCERLPLRLRMAVALRVGWGSDRLVERLITDPDARPALAAFASWDRPTPLLAPYLDVLAEAGVPLETRIFLTTCSREGADSHVRALVLAPETRPAAVETLLAAPRCPAGLAAWLSSPEAALPTWQRLHFLECALDDPVGPASLESLAATLDLPAARLARTFHEAGEEQETRGWRRLPVPAEHPDAISRALSAIHLPWAREVLRRIAGTRPVDLALAVARALETGRPSPELLDLAVGLPQVRRQAVLQILGGGSNLPAARVVAWLGAALADPELRGLVLAETPRARGPLAAALARDPELDPVERVRLAAEALKGAEVLPGSVGFLLGLLELPRAAEGLELVENMHEMAWQWPDEESCAFMAAGELPPLWRVEVALRNLHAHPREARRTFEQASHTAAESVTELLLGRLRYGSRMSLLQGWVPPTTDLLSQARLEAFRLRDPRSRPVARLALEQMLVAPATREAALDGLRESAGLGCTSAMRMLWEQADVRWTPDEDDWDLDDPAEFVRLLQEAGPDSTLSRQVRTWREIEREQLAAIAVVVLFAAGHLEFEEALGGGLALLEPWPELHGHEVVAGLFGTLLAGPRGAETRRFLVSADWSGYRLAKFLGSLLLNDLAAEPAERLGGALKGLAFDKHFTNELANAIVRLLETDPAGPEIASLFQEQRDLPTGDHLIDAQAWVRAHDPRHSPEERTRALVRTLRDRWREQGGFASEVSERAIGFLRSSETREPLLRALQEHWSPRGPLESVAASLLTDDSLRESDREHLVRSFYASPHRLDGILRRLATQPWTAPAARAALRRRESDCPNVALVLAEVEEASPETRARLALQVLRWYPEPEPAPRLIHHLTVALADPASRAVVAGCIRRYFPIRGSGEPEDDDVDERTLSDEEYAAMVKRCFELAFQNHENRLPRYLDRLVRSATGMPPDG